MSTIAPRQCTQAVLPATEPRTQHMGGGPEANGHRQLAETLNFFDKWPVGRFFALLFAVAHRGSGHQTSNEKVV